MQLCLAALIPSPEHRVPLPWNFETPLPKGVCQHLDLPFITPAKLWISPILYLATLYVWIREFFGWRFIQLGVIAGARQSPRSS